MKRLAIIGSGDLGQLIAHHAAASGEYEVTGFFNDFEAVGKLVKGFPILGKVKDIQAFYESGTFDCLMIGIGYKHMETRKKLFLDLQYKIPFANVIHSSAIIDASVRLGSGVFILPGCVLDMNVKIGDNVLLNTGVTIAHDTEVKSHSFLSPRVAIAGFTRVGEGCIIGINTTLIDNISIAPGTQTGGGAVVCESIEQAGLYVGVPAKRIK